MMKISKKILTSFCVISFGLFITPSLLACSNNSTTPPSIDEPINPPTNGYGVTIVKSDSTNLGHAVPNQNINTTNPHNAYLMADSQYIPANNEGNGEILQLQTDYISNNQYLNMSKRSYSIIFKEGYLGLSTKMGTA